MIAYINPPHGNDATGLVAADAAAAHARPFQTHKAAVEALEASKKQHPAEPHTLRESHKAITPQISPIQS